MRLHYKIILLITVILTLVIGSIGYLSFREIQQIQRHVTGQKVQDLAWTVAAMNVVKENLNKPNGHLKIQWEIERLRLKIGVQYIVVIDMNGIRYSHPLPERVGEYFVGGDETRVLRTGEAYVSESIGVLGPSLRAFAPVYRDGVQVGAVAVGVLTGRVRQEIYAATYKFLTFFLCGLVLGITGAVLLSYNIKKTLFGLEPDEIALLAGEKDAILQSVKEGIIALDRDGQLRLFNQTARQLLGLREEDIGQSWEEMSYSKRILDVLASGEPLYDQETRVRPGLTVICNYHPLVDEYGQISGVVASFRDITEITRLAEELTGVKKMTEALRAQNHEFMNKLHTIAGLIQLGEGEQAISYISETVNTRQEVLGVITRRIKEPSIAGLLLAKYHKAVESRVDLEIKKESYLSKLPEGMRSEELGSILGNLIENALDAVIRQKSGKISVLIHEHADDLQICIHDNGPGIAESVRERLYLPGVSTRGEHRGYGLMIVKEIVDAAGGDIAYEMEGGTLWKVWLPVRKEDCHVKGFDCGR